MSKKKNDNDSILITINSKKYKVINPISIIRAYFLFDKSFINYDAKSISCFSDAVRISNKLGARLSEKNQAEVITYYNQNKKTIDKLLDEIPDKDIIHIKKDRLEKCQGNVNILIKKLEVNNGVGQAVATKILHKTRPMFIPILDKRITSLYKNTKDDKLIGTIHNDIIKSNDSLIVIQESIPIELTKNRIFDKLLWMKSGENELYKKGIKNHFFLEEN